MDLGRVERVETLARHADEPERLAVGKVVLQTHAFRADAQRQRVVRLPQTRRRGARGEPLVAGLEPARPAADVLAEEREHGCGGEQRERDDDPRRPHEGLQASRPLRNSFAARPRSARSATTISGTEMPELSESTTPADPCPGFAATPTAPGGSSSSK